MPISPIIIHPMNNGYINSLTPTINGTGEPNASIHATLNNIDYTTQVKPNGTWAFDVQKPLVEGSSYQFSVTQTNAGNEVTTSPTVSFQANPKLMTAHTVASPQANQYVNTATPTVQGTGKAGATINVAAGSGTYSTVVNADGSWSVMLNAPLSQGTNTVSVTQIDMGNMSPPASVSFQVDTVAPPEPVVVAPADMAVLKTQRPVISGQGEPGASIDAILDEKTYHAVVNPGGAWSMEVSEALADTDHVLSVKQRDAANNISPAKVLVFTVDTKLPDAPAVHSPAASQFVTTALPVIRGSGEAGNTIQAVFADRMYTATIGSDGSWQVKISDRLPDGNQTIKLYQVDKAGNVSMPTDLLLKIDTSVPAAPAVLFPVQNGFVNATPFTMHGTGEPDGAVMIKVASRELTAQVNRDGSWSIPMDLPNKHPYTATICQRDAAGNHSQTAELKFHVDAGSLTAPAVNAPATGGWISSSNPALSGTAQPGATVYAGIGSAIKTVTADGKGTWQLQLGHLPQGQHSVHVWQDAMGNMSPQTVLSFGIKTCTPTAPAIQAPANLSQIDGGTVRVSGMAEPGARLDIRVDTQTLSAVADANGNWSAALPGALPNGSHAILARQTDRAGNTGPYASVLFQTHGQATAAATQDALPVVAQITCNPCGPQWQAQTIAVLNANKPIQFGGVQGTCFAQIVTCNGLCSFAYTDLAGTEYTAVVGVDWLDDLPPVVDITPNGTGNFFTVGKTVHYYKYGPSGLKSALLNGEPCACGTSLSAEGWYTVAVSDNAGNVSTRSFVIDLSPPTVAGIGNGATVNADVTLNFYDTLSGVKSATLNGTPIATGSVINTNGSYQLHVCDNAGNATQIQFQINKP